MSGRIPPPALAELARITEGDQDVDVVLQRVVRHATSLVPGCSGAGLTVLSPDGGETAAVTDDRVRRCHERQFAPGGRGPGRETLAHGEPRLSDDFEQEERWPEFAEAALEQGFRSFLSLPLGVGRTPSGARWATALDLYAEAPAAFSGTTFDIALLYAATGGVAIGNAELYRSTQDMLAHLHRTLVTRSVIERAKGLLMGRHGLSSEQAFEVLRQQSQHTHRRLRDVAADLVGSPLEDDPDVPWTPPRPASHPRRADRTVYAGDFLNYGGDHG